MLSVGKPGHYEDLDVGGRIILKWIRAMVGCGGVDRTDPVQDEDQLRALLNTVLNLRVT
jgi:hypothetical protein